MFDSKRFTGFLLRGVALLVINLVMANCSKDNGTAPDTSLYSSQDDAEAIAAAVAFDPGGATDQMGYLSDLASTDGIQAVSKSVADAAASSIDVVKSVDTTYDEGQQRWTIQLSYQRNNPDRGLQANFTRTYTVQFLKNGVAQKHFVNGSDTANSIKFDIEEGTGDVQSNRLAHHLNALSGSWTATGITQNVMTVAGNYYRAGSDTLRTRNATRTFNYSLSLEFAGVTIPCGSGDDAYRYIAGGMNGQFQAAFTITRGAEVVEKSVDHPFSLAFALQRLQIEVSGHDFGADIETGEIIE